MDVNTILGVLGIVKIAISLFQKLCVKGVEAKMDALEKSMELLSEMKADISYQLEQEEAKPGKKRKRQVHSWMEIVRWQEDQVRQLGREVRERPLLSSLMWADRVRDLATQVEELQKKGRFDHGLTLDVKPARGYELKPGELVGQASQRKRDVKPVRGPMNLSGCWIYDSTVDARGKVGVCRR